MQHIEVLNTCINSVYFNYLWLNCFLADLSKRRLPWCFHCPAKLCRDRRQEKQVTLWIGQLLHTQTLWFLQFGWAINGANADMMPHTERWLGRATFVALEQREQTEGCCYGNEGKGLPLRSHLQRTNLCHQFLTHTHTHTRAGHKWQQILWAAHAALIPLSLFTHVDNTSLHSNT